MLALSRSQRFGNNSSKTEAKLCRRIKIRSAYLCVDSDFCSADSDNQLIFVNEKDEFIKPHLISVRIDFTCSLNILKFIYSFDISEDKMTRRTGMNMFKSSL